MFVFGQESIAPMSKYNINLFIVIVLILHQPIKPEKKREKLIED